MLKIKVRGRLAFAYGMGQKALRMLSKAAERSSKLCEHMTWSLVVRLIDIAITTHILCDALRKKVRTTVREYSQ